jgi:ribosomal protein S18 acetylase RimI-like enzyme
MIETTLLRPEDHDRWEVLARGYKTFYKTALPPSDYDWAWQRLLQADTVHGIGARLDGRLVGIAHYLFHANIWTGDACYLQDLYVDAAVRGQGIGRALIGRVAEAAEARGAERYYWHTAVDNTVARALYDKLAQHKGFIRYDYPLD